jgi:hypothetical protein
MKWYSKSASYMRSFGLMVGLFILTTIALPFLIVGGFLKTALMF